MSELRKIALDHAVTVASMVRTDRIYATEVVAAAEAFYAFLTSQQERLVPHPSPVAAGYDLARADQSPTFVVVSGQPGDPNIYGSVEVNEKGEFMPVTSILRDADSIPTRLVRRDGTPPDAA